MVLKHVDFEVADWGELAVGPRAWAAYAQALADLEPVAHWRLGEASGSTAAEETGAHVAAYIGGVTFGHAGAVFRDTNTAAGFDGIDARVAVAHAAALNLGGTSAATWLMWVRKATAGDDAGRWTLGKGSAAEGELRYLIEVRGEGGTIDFVTYDGGWHAVSSEPGQALAGWRLIGVTWDGVGTLAFYHDGEAVGTAPFDAQWFPGSDGALTLGAAHASAINDDLFHYAGELQDVALFDKALSAEQVADLYARATGMFRLPAGG